MSTFVDIAIKSAWWSKVNWTQVIGMAASFAVYSGLDIPPETQAKLIATIQAVSGIATIILRTWFTTSLTPAALERLEATEE